MPSVKPHCVELHILTFLVLTFPKIDNVLSAGGTFDLVPEFKPGILKASLRIPTFSIVHRTEILWKNMVAYQSATTGPNERGLTDQFIYFLKFMDELVNTQDDVSLAFALDRTIP